MRTEDGSIIHECLNGKPQAFGVLVDKYREGIYAYAYAELRDFQDAQDVTQEVFLQAYRDLRSLRRRESFAFWLYRIAHRRCVQCCRDRSRRIDQDFIEDQDPGAVDSPSLDSYREGQLDDSVREALDSLPDAYREVLVLHYFGGMTIKDMARAMGVSPGAIGMRLSRARAQLRKEMVDTMDAAFERQRLPVGFTFRIVEAVKRIRIHPMPRMAGLPWGISFATGLLVTILSLSPYINVSFINPADIPTGSPLPAESKELKVGEIPVDVVKTSDISVISNLMGKGKGGEPKQPDLQNTFFMAPQDEGKWTKKDNLPEVIGYHSAGVVNGKIYLIGGGDSIGNAFSSVAEYNPDIGRCNGKTDMPTSRGYLGACVVDNKIYAVGGFEPGRVNSKAVEEFDPTTGKWEKKADMLTARTALAVSTVNGKIYAIGGFANNQNLSTIEEYDPKNDKWIRKADMPKARSHMSSGVVRGKIYVIGGLEDSGQGGRFLSTVEEYDPATDKWAKKADMPTARCLLSTSATNGKIYAIGGWDGIREFSTVEMYDPVTNEWTNGPDMPTGRNGFTASIVNGKIYAIGGYSKNLGWLSTVEEYDTGFAGESVEAKGKLPTKWGEVKSSRE